VSFSASFPRKTIKTVEHVKSEGGRFDGNNPRGDKNDYSQLTAVEVCHKL
jgi:hypothetical protein